MSLYPKDRVSKRDYSAYIIVLTIPPEMIDVNVHPSKAGSEIQGESASARIGAFYLKKCTEKYEKDKLNLPTEVSQCHHVDGRLCGE